jgi:hypothetical protein
LWTEEWLQHESRRPERPADRLSAIFDFGEWFGRADLEGVRFPGDDDGDP